MVLAKFSAFSSVSRHPLLRRRQTGRRLRCQVSDDQEADKPKRPVAVVLVDTFIKDGMRVGVDSGTLCTETIQELGHRLDSGSLRGVRIVAANDAAASEAAFVGVPQAASADCDKVDVMFAQVDEVDVTDPSLPFIYGRATEPAQPQIPRFRALARKAEHFVALLTSEKQAVARLSKTLPVVIQNSGWEETADAVDDVVVGEAEVWRRPADATDTQKAPDAGSSPYVSPEGHNILDVRYYNELMLFGDASASYNKICDEIMSTTGVVSVGLLEDVAQSIAICSGDDAKVISKQELVDAAEASPEMVDAAMDVEE